MITKACTHCGTAFKPASGKQRYCGLKCRTVAYNAANPEKILKHQAAYRATHRDEIAKRNAAYNAAYRDELAKRKAASL